MYNIFISYSSKDQDIADKIYKIATERYGLSCWLAPSETGIKPGEFYPEAIINGIENSQVIVFIESKSSMQSKYVFRELERGVHYGKCIIRYTIERYSFEGLETAKKIIDFFTCVEQHIDASINPLDCINSLCEASKRLLGEKSSIIVRQSELIGKIKTYMNKRSLADNTWVGAISSQYFLIEIAFLLGLTERIDYYELEEEFYAHSCKLARGGRIIPAPMQILVVPSENEKLIANMQDEENSGEFYPDRLLAKHIDTQNKKDLIFYNYYYGLMAGIIDRLCFTNSDNIIYQAIRAAVIEQLFKKEAQDLSGGLYHYRLPWITARALISLARYDKQDIRQTMKERILLPNSEYAESSDFEDLKQDFLNSIIERMEPCGYWKSGAGNWVTRWESTGLCLESIYVNNGIGKYKNEIEKIFKYICSDENKKEWLKCYGFENATNSNKTLSNIILASVCFRIIKNNKIEGYKKEYVEILALFEECYKSLCEAKQDNVQQQCTLPQCLYYILVAIREEQNGLE